MGLLGEIVGGVVGAVGGAVVGTFVGGPGVGTVAGAVVGGVAGAAEGDSIGGSSPSASPQYPPSPDYSDAMVVESNNSKTVALAQIMGQEFTMQQASTDRELKMSADLELGLETLDTKLQTGKMEYLQGMKGEENRHAEKLAQLAAQNTRLENGGKTQAQASFDIPAPEGF